MSAIKARISKMKWWIIDNLFVLPLKLAIESLYNPVLVRLLQTINSRGKLDFLLKEIIMEVKTVSQLSRLRSCKKEPSTIKWLLRDLLEGDVLFDIGANVGAYSLVAAAAGTDNLSVYSFEPSPSTFASLCKNVSLNNFGNKIYPLQMALGAKTEVSKFFLSSNVAGSAEHALGEAIDMYGNSFIPVEIQTVISITMDDVIKIFEIKTPTHIKIDVDGFELNVLQGAKGVLTSSRIRHLLIEVREDSEECLSILNLLNEFGFKVVRKGYATTEGFSNYEFERS
jgi:FkbM family methyltransferase